MYWNSVVKREAALARLARLRGLGADSDLPSLRVVTDEELSIFAGSGAAVLDNGLNLRLSGRQLPYPGHHGGGGRVGPGTDGISFSDCEDMFAELRLAAYLQRDPRDFELARLDRWSCCAPRQQRGAAMRQRGSGAVGGGAFADLLLVDTERILSPRGGTQHSPLLDVSSIVRRRATSVPC